jgi:hypothetical protein
MAPPREASLPAANRVFVDREPPQRIFEEAAFSIPADRAIIRVFHGVGGQGKTALCRELMRKTDASLDPTYAFLRRALLDLHGRPKTDPDLLLVWIRNAFADAGLFLPCFDLALALAWQGTRSEEPFPVLTKPWLARLTRAAKGAVGEGGTELQRLLGGETATELFGEAIGEIPGLKFIIKGLGGWVIDKSKRAYLERTREPLQRLYKDGELRRSYELSSVLPWMLAQDLNYHLSRNPMDRFVLFIDEYERVFDQGGAGARWVENPFASRFPIVPGAASFYRSDSRTLDKELRFESYARSAPPNTTLRAFATNAPPCRKYASSLPSPLNQERKQWHKNLTNWSSALARYR